MEVGYDSITVLLFIKTDVACVKYLLFSFPYFPKIEIFKISEKTTAVSDFEF